MFSEIKKRKFRCRSGKITQLTILNQGKMTRHRIGMKHILFWIKDGIKLKADVDHDEKSAAGDDVPVNDRRRGRV